MALVCQLKNRLVNADFCGNLSFVLLDTNAIINSALLPQSFSACAVSLARQQQVCRFLVSAGGMREVSCLLRKKATDEDLRNLAEMRVAAFLDWLGASHIDDDDSSSAPHSISKADRHIFHAAKCHGATVLTSDPGLWLGLRECNIPSLLPLEWIRHMDGMALASTIFGVPPSAVAGSLFVRAYPGAWAGGKTGKFTAASFPGGFWLYFDANRSCWVAEVAGLSKPLFCKTQIQDSTLQTVCLSWDAMASSPKIELRVAGVDHPVDQPLAGPLDFRPLGHPSVGSLCGKGYFWNGHIYSCVSNDRPVGKGSWKSYLRHRDLAPNPYDADRVAGAIATIRSVQIR